MIITSSFLELISELKGVYYTLVLENKGNKYFVLKRSGKIGDPYKTTLEFCGIQILKKDGYDFESEAFVQAKYIINSKQKSNKKRKYRLLKKNEVFEDQNQTIELKIIPQIKHKGYKYIPIDHFIEKEI